MLVSGCITELGEVILGGDFNGRMWTVLFMINYGDAHITTLPVFDITELLAMRKSCVWMSCEGRGSLGPVPASCPFDHIGNINPAKGSMLKGYTTLHGTMTHSWYLFLRS